MIVTSASRVCQKTTADPSPTTAGSDAPATTVPRNSFSGRRQFRITREAELPEALVSDPLYLSLWFPSFSGPEMLPHILAVLKQFPFSPQRPGINYLALHPVSRNEATLLEQRFTPPISPEEEWVTPPTHTMDALLS